MPDTSSPALLPSCRDGATAADSFDGAMPMRGSLVSDEPPVPRTRFRMRELDLHIGRRIREARVVAGLSMQALGGRMGLTYQQVQKYEAGTDRLSVAVLLELTRIFARPFDWFCGPFMPRPDAPADALPAEAAELLHHALAAGDSRDRALVLDLLRRFAGAVSAPSVSPGGAAGRILLVDDSPDVLVMLGAFLEADGFAVVRAPSGGDALAHIAHDGRFDAVVTDYAMPDMSGVEMLRRIAPRHPDLPALIITGFATSLEGLADLPRTVEVLRKPFRRLELLARVRLLSTPARAHSVGR